MVIGSQEPDILLFTEVIPEAQQKPIDDSQLNVAQEQQMKLSSKNIIIRGVQEDAEEKQAEADKDFVNELLTILRLEVMPEQIVRLGKKSQIKIGLSESK